MNNAQPTYCVQNRFFTKEELVDWCTNLLETAEPWLAENCRFILNWLDDSPYFLASTSGSTGEPKTIQISKKEAESSAKLTAQYFDIRKDSKVLLCLPANYIAGKMVIVRGLVNGWNLHWVKPSSNPLEELVDDFDFASCTPMQLVSILRHSPEQFGRLRKVIIGGAALSFSLEQALKPFQNELYETYGMTETISHVAVRKLNGNNDLFHALPGVRFAQKENGCLIVSAQHLGNQTFVTNDIVRLVGPLSFQLLGRIDNVINSGGIKLFPERIERKLARLIEDDFFLTKENDDRLGERMVLYIRNIPYDSGKQLRLRSSMKLILDTYEMPADIRFRSEFEYTETGKIIRKLL